MLFARDLEQARRPVHSVCPVGALAAISYDDGPAFDLFAFGLARDLRQAGWRLAGVAQVNEARPKRGRCDMMLEDLGTGHTILISEDRGPQARGCRLNSSALLEAGELIRHQLSGTVDLVLINKFGKSEAEGHGLRDVIAEAVSQGIPTLVGVPARNMQAWLDFSGGDVKVLPACQADVQSWLHGSFRDLMALN